jgi:hypothetical protein
VFAAEAELWPSRTRNSAWWISRVVVERRVARRRRLGGRRIQKRVERNLRVDRHRATARQPDDQVRTGCLQLPVTGEMGLSCEVEMLGQAGRLGDPTHRGLGPLPAHAGTAERVRQATRLADEPRLLVNTANHETAQLAAVPALVDTDLLHGAFELGELGQRRGRLAPAGEKDQDGVVQPAPAMKAIKRGMNGRSRNRPPP